MRPTFFLIAIALFSLYNSVNAQLVDQHHEDCQIYESILSFLIAKELGVEFLYTAPSDGIDPTDSLIGKKEKVETLLSLNFEIARPLLSQKPSAIENNFAAPLELSELLDKEYASTQDSIVSCSFSPQIHYSIDDYKTRPQYSSNDYYTKIEHGQAVQYGPAKIHFSNILYTEDNSLALVYASVNAHITQAPPLYYFFVFSQNNGHWSIVDHQHQQR